MFYFVIT